MISSLGKLLACDSIAVERLDQALQVLSLNVRPEGREVRAPGIPKRNRKQGEHEHAEDDVSKR
jgi:hypothetical protein